jgi:hypothetical protein
LRINLNPPYPLSFKGWAVEDEEHGAVLATVEFDQVFQFHLFKFAGWICTITQASSESQEGLASTAVQQGLLPQAVVLRRGDGVVKGMKPQEP